MPFRLAILKISRAAAESSKRIWQHGLRPGSPSALVFAIGCVVAAALTRHLLGLIDPATGVFAPYFPAVLAATLIAGFSSGLVALVLSTLSAWWSFLPPSHALLPLATNEAVSLLIFCVAAAIVVVAAEGHRRLLRSYYQKEQFNRLLVRELQHRPRNNLAVVQAVLRCDLRDDADLWRHIAGRLGAIARADELLQRSNDKGAEMAEIVNNELGPYAARSRIMLAGDPLVLPPMLALSLTLIMHELSTNAVKYGALSNSSGRIGVAWKVDRGQVQLIWNECGGPAARRPTHYGFGSELLQRLLVPFHGSVEREFASDGMRCVIAFGLPRNRHLPFGVRRKTFSSA
jgi:two-component sensor histidine kinase